MKKMTLSILAGLMIIGSAFAVPGPEDRKALCDKHPDKYVWVEKTKACIPINPCDPTKSSNWFSGVRDAYCLDALTYSPLYLPKDDDTARDLIINRFISNYPVLGKNPSIKFLDDHTNGYYYVAFFTEDKNYLVAEIYDIDFSVQDLYETVNAAASAYGVGIMHYKNYSNYGADSDLPRGMAVEDFAYVDGKYTVKKCEDIADFASLLYGKPLIHYSGKDGVCWIQVVDDD